MYAIFTTGGKQYRVSQGDTLDIEKLDAEEGASVDFNDVLMVSNDDAVQIGAPFVAGGKVTATVTDQCRGKKVEIVKFRRRKHHQKQTGHRQHITKVEITAISA